MAREPDRENGLLPWAGPPAWADLSPRLLYRLYPRFRSRSRSRSTSHSRFRNKTFISTRLTRRCRRLFKMVAILSLVCFASLALSARIRPVQHAENGMSPSPSAGAGDEPGPDTMFREESDQPSSSSGSSSSDSSTTEDGWPASSASPAASVPPFPYAHGTDFYTHDPTIIKHEDTFYSYTVGPGMIIHEASSLDGPWKQTGTVLNGSSVIQKGDNKSPWAPNVIQLGDTFYCYYSVSNSGCRDSAIGVATSATPGPGNWTDHGLMIQSGTGEGSEIYPMNQSNAIDPNIFVDHDGSVYMQFGSFWSGLYQVTLDDDYLTVDGVEDKSLHSSHLAAEPGKVWRARKAGSKNKSPVCGDPTGGHPIEGGFLAYHEPYYYMWFSWGRCCEFSQESMRHNGQEYRIRVGRSESANGPFVDKAGIDLIDGGGETIYGSNADVFAPGGQGLMSDQLGDILYYHYLNTTESYDFGSARLGYNRLTYIDGWPIAV